MGLYDTVWIRCPKCSEAVDFQSKAGNCVMNDYEFREDDIPQAILADLNGQKEKCHKCGTTLKPKAIVFIEIETEP